MRIQAERGLTLRSVLVDMGNNGLVVHDALRNTILVSADRRHDRERAGVDLRAPVANDTNHDLLPVVLAPRLRTITRAH